MASKPRSVSGIVVAAGVLVVALAITLVLLFREPPREQRNDSPPAAGSSPGERRGAGGRVASPVPATASPGAGRASPPAPTRPSLPAVAERQRELAKIAHQGVAPAGGAPGSAATGAPTGDGGVRTLDKTAIQAGIRAVVPKIRTCYDTWLRSAASADRRKDLRIKADFTIVAKAGEGRIDEGEAIPYEEGAEGAEAAGSEGGSLQDVTLRSCLLQALTTATFPVPPGDGKVRVRYPFVMRTKQPPAKR